MNKKLKVFIVILLVIAVAVVIAVKQSNKTVRLSEVNQQKKGANDSNTVIIQTQQPETPKKLPQLVDLGADKCIPCKMMAPILEELRAEYENNFEVIFIDVWKEPQQGHKYNIELIPTQIFIDATGKELFRHEGFFAKEDILAKWKELGFDFSKAK